MTLLKHVRLAVVTIAVGLLAGAFAHGETHVVTQSGLTFSPADITVAPGDTVRWEWTSGSHTVTSGTPCTHDNTYFDAPLDSANTVFEFVVPTGVAQIPYFCVPHCGIGMTGTINIQSQNLVDFTIQLDGDQAGVDTMASGSGSATLDADTNFFSWDFSFSDLEGNQTAAHFHGPAGPCETAGVEVPVSTGTQVMGSMQLTQQQADDLLMGLWYLNIHSDLHPAGEIRGQVYPAALSDPIGPTIPLGQTINLQTVATGLTAPNWGTTPPGDDRLWVTDQDGILWAIDLSDGSKTVMLDVTARLVSLGIGGPDTFDERGLLGVAFHPDYATNGKLYTYTSEPDAGSPDFSTMPTGFAPNHQSVVAEWQVPNPSDPASVVDPNTRRELLRIDQPQFNHDGGAIQFGPDGMLYIALGDGGARDDKDGGPPAAGDPVVGHGCLGNGADTSTILGSIVRIDVDGSNAANGEYGIPADNPFVGMAGVDEIYAYGFRNPFRISFDMMTGDLWAPDVGQNDIEEVNTVVSGGNYGWRWKEGSFFFVFNGNEPGYVTDMPLDVPAGLIDPIAEYDHDDGLAIVGGFVYRGTALPHLSATYVFGDFAQTFSNDGRLFYLDANDDIVEFELPGQNGLGLSLLGFGQDASGEVYVLANSTGTPFQDTGVVLRLVLFGDVNCDGLVNAGDIDPFVLALTDPAGYAAQFPDCNIMHADANGDGLINAGDIDPFVTLLTGG